jgi:hypothetical protein
VLDPLAGVRPSVAAGEAAPSVRGVGEAAPVPVAVPEKLVVATADLLDDDEIVQLSIRPSPWFVLIAAGPTLGACALVAGGLWWVTAEEALFGTLAVYVVLLIALVRVAYATLQWASRLYVLTNRRVIRFRGVLNVEFAQCLLARISAVELRFRWYDHALRLGAIRMPGPAESGIVVHWDHVARPHEIHELLVRAIRKSQNGAAH